MKPGYEIDQYGTRFDIQTILVFNWQFSNKIGMACYATTDLDKMLIPEKHCVAIFKIKWK